MKRTIVISEEFGMYRVETSNGAAATGPNLAGALSSVASTMGLRWPRCDIYDIFENLRERDPSPRDDGPVAA